MYEIKVTVDVPGLPEAISSLANALSRVQQPADNTPATAVPQDVPTNPTIPSIPSTDRTVTAATISPAQSSPTAPVTESSIPTTGSTPPTSEVKSYTLDDISRAGAALIDQGKMPQLLDLLKRYGAQAVTQLAPSVYPTFVEEMKALGAKL